jgi:NAD(P)-dependent dehydrogenase (short-subunit alcohol dehydrogenase family)
LALEVVSHGIRVAIIEPGFFNTPILDKASEPVIRDAGSPYEAIERRMGTLYAGAKTQGAGDPIDVAKMIEHAITTEKPQLRYHVGADAAPFVEGRARMGDQEYIESFGHEQTDVEWFAEFARRFPLPAA